MINLKRYFRLNEDKAKCCRRQFNGDRSAKIFLIHIAIVISSVVENNNEQGQFLSKSVKMDYNGQLISDFL